MSFKPEDLFKMQQESFKATSSMAAKVFESFQKLAELNAHMTKQAFAQAAERNMALMTAKDPKTAAELMGQFAKPDMSGPTEIAKNIYDMITTTRAEFTDMAEKNLAEANKQMLAAIDALAKSAPPGSEGAISFMKQSVNTATAAYEQFSKAAKQFSDAVEKQVASAAQASQGKGK